MRSTHAFDPAIDRTLVDRCSARLVALQLDGAAEARSRAAKELARHQRIDARVARLALDAAFAGLTPPTPPPRPTTASAATDAQHDQHSPPATCWNCTSTAHWKAHDSNARWLCARCSPPDHDDAIVWHDATEPELEDAKREPRWTETPDRDDYVLLRTRKLAREAARTAADFLGSWRAQTTRKTADLRVVDWHAITDASAVMAAAEELNAWAVDQDVRARVITCRALAATIGWPVRAIAPVLDRALDLLRRLSGEEAIAALGSKWPADHAAGSSDPVLLRIDAVTAVYTPAHPHLHILLRGMKPARKSLKR